MPPPNSSEFLTTDGLTPSRLLDVLRRRDIVDDEHLPWDRLRYKTPPTDLTLEEWWLILRMRRRQSERELPLMQIDGSPFVITLSDGVLRKHDSITRQASGNVKLHGRVVSPGSREEYVVSSLLEEAITSSQLEGATSTRRDAARMIRDRRTPRTKSELMILNNYLAMQRIVEVKDEPLTPDLVREIHRIVTDGTLENPAMAGVVQSNPDPDDRIAVRDDDDNVLHRPPPVDQLDDRLIALCEFANGDDTGAGPYLPAVVRAALIHFMVGYDHYFEDGNGRTARSLFYWSLLRQGYWMAEYLSISTILRKAPSQYSRAFLHTEQDEGDTTYFVLHQLDVILRSLAELQDYLAVKTVELERARTTMRMRREDFNHRQLSVIESSLRDPHTEFTVATHASIHRVTDPTARNDLADLQAKGYLVSWKRGRQVVWRSAPDLATTLERPRE